MNDALLVVVTAYSYPHAVLSIDGTAYLDVHDAEAAARYVQTRAIESVLQVDLPDRRIHQVVAYGDPVEVLVAESNEADLLVVGRRTSRIRRLLTGSVSKRCANRAACPVVIVHAAPGTGRTPKLPTDRFVAPTAAARGASNVDDDDRRGHHERRHAHIEAHRHRS